jgi:hypothetical protein
MIWEDQNMTIEFPFELNQKVWPIENRHEQYWEVCPACEGEGVVTLKNGSRSCPSCYGRRGSMQYKPTKWMIVEGRDNNGHWLYAAPLTIGQIRIYLGPTDEPNRLMMHETGVGSGTLWDASKCFSTKEEAQAECDKLNAL